MSPSKRVGSGVAPEDAGPFEPVWVHPEWKRPGTARLRHPLALEGLEWPAGTVVHLGYDGTVEAIELPDAREVKGHRCDAGMVVWLRDGQLRSYEGVLREDRRIDGLLLKAGTRVEVRAPGMLVEATLAAEQEVLGLRLPSCTRVSFRHEPGGPPALDLLHLPRPWEIHGVSCDRGRVSFFEGGGLYEAWLAKRCEFDGILCEAEGIGFHRGGRLARASVGKGTVIAGLPCAGPVRLDEAGRVEALTLASDFQVNGVWLAEGSTVRFHPSGRVAQGVLGRDWTQGEVLLPRGCRVWLDEAGRVREAHLDGRCILPG